MKKRITFLSAALMLLAFLAVPLGMRGQTRAEVVAYTLQPASGSNNSYTGNCDITIDGITWNLTGNSQQIPWRIGGKNLTNVDRPLYSKTAISDNISKIEVTHGSANSITVNSWTVIVASDVSFDNVVSTLTPDFEAEETTTINRPDGVDWTNCYYKFVYNVSVSGNTNRFIQFTQAAFYKEEGSVSAPSITAENVEIEYDDEEGEIEYTINNPAEGGQLTVSTESGWLTLGQGTASPIQFTCSANAGTERTATVTLTYTYNTDQTVTKDVTVTQAAAPVIYTTIPDIFAAATSTETSVFVTFNDWVVSGVSTNGKNVFVTDNEGNGFVIYSSDDMSETYSVGNVLSGTAVSCSLKLYNGFAELLNVNADDLMITEGGAITTVEVALADLSGVNTGALLHYDNLTCSVSNNKYYLSDGTTTLQVYNSLFAFEALEDGKTYNITGVYQQYNYTKEILPRSANDIEEVIIVEPSVTVTPNTINAPAEGAEGTIEVTYANITEVAAEVWFCDAAGTTDVTYDWITAEINSDNNVYYLIGANEDEARTAYFKVWAYDDELNEVYSDLVTVNQDAYVAPSMGDEYVLYTGELVEGDYIIYYDGSAMKNTVENSRLSYETVTPNNDVIITDNATIVWHIAQIGDYWTIYSADADAYAAGTGVKNKAQMLEDGISDYAMWTVSGTEEYEFVNKGNSNDGVNAYLRNNVNINNNYGFACYAVGTGGDLSLYKKNIETETYELHVNGYGDSEGGYVLLASPVYANPTNTGMITDDGTDEQNLTYDFYYFDQSQDLEWINYRAHNFNIIPGKGYLYASKNGVDLTFTGIPYSGNGQITLKKTENAEFEGWNLVGNPFGNAATISKAYYKLKEDGSDVNPETENSAIDVMEGVFVVAETNGETVTFTEQTTPNNDSEIAQMNINVSKSRGESVDRAIVRFDNGNQLPKFQLNPNHTKLYIPQGNNEYAIVRSDAQGEMPVNFKAQSNGTYTISIDAKNVEVSYLHLIDNMTGADVDLLATPSYTFDANTTDYANRFRLVFSANNVNDNTTSETFAYFNGSEWSISNTGRATLQVVDVLGRIVSSESINGNTTLSTTNLKDGVYMFRLVNGENVKVQKVVVK